MSGTKQKLDLQGTLADAFSVVEGNGGPSVVFGDGGVVAGVVGDTELRFAEFHGDSLSAPISRFMNTRFLLVQGGDEAEARKMLNESEFDVAVHTREGAEDPEVLEVDSDAGRIDTAILMAGGEGVRLRPLTADMPKPLLPIGNRPILEHIVRHLQSHGVRRVVIALGYLADQIRGHFGDGSDLGVCVEYVEEKEPLGTAGAIGMVDVPEGQPLLVMNGDVLTDLDVSAMARYHHRENAAVTLAAHAYHHQVPYGVFRFAGNRIVALDEKPIASWWANSGVYLMDPEVVRGIQPDTYLDMTVLVEQLIARGRQVCPFPVREYWCDIGLAEDYERAVRLWESRGRTPSGNP